MTFWGATGLITDEDNLKKIKSLYQQYVESPVHRFKSCFECIVILQIDPDTPNNESRSVADENYATFRAKYMMPIAIFEKRDPRMTREYIDNTSYHKTLTYEVGSLANVEDFDNDIDMVSSAGIHYFKSIDAAYYWNPPTKKPFLWKNDGSL